MVMSIDFTLPPDQQKLQKIARAFSEDVLKPVVKEADLEPDTQKAFQMMKGPYKEAYKLGFAMGFLPKEYGGGGISNVDLQIVAEEITAESRVRDDSTGERARPDAGRLVRQRRAEAQMDRCRDQRQEP